MEVAHIIHPRHNQRHINGRRFQSAVCPRSNQLSILWTGTRGIPHQVTDNPCHIHCVPIRTESGLGCPPVIHHNRGIVCDIALGDEIPKMVRLELISLQQQT